jgi:hypothetical protein
MHTSLPTQSKEHISENAASSITAVAVTGVSRNVIRVGTCIQNNGGLLQRVLRTLICVLCPVKYEIQCFLFDIGCKWITL